MRFLLLVWMFVVPFIKPGAAQDLTPSISWKASTISENPNITSSKDDRIGVASAALEKAVSMLQSNGQFNDSTYDTPGRLYAQMAEFDRLTNQTKYKQTLKQYFDLAESIDYGLNYGYAAARAYTAYRDPDFLALAVTSWTSARRYTISKKQAVSGFTDVKQFNLSTSCQGATLTGGTYFSTDSNDTNLHSMATGFFLAVSALLAEATSNQTYLDAAIESASFIQSHLLDPSNTVMAFMSSKLNESCSVYTTAYSPNTGIFVEGLVILADITRNTSTEALLRSIIVTVITDTSWQGLDGILSIATNGGHYIVRALAALYERNTTSSDLREYIKEYLGVQYNAVIEKATSGGSNIYGIPWTGLPSTSFSSENQTVAVSALLSAIQLLDGQSMSKSSDKPTPSGTPTAGATTSPLPPKKTPTGAIVGGVAGGLAVLVVIIVGSFLLRRGDRRRNHQPFVVDWRSSRTLTPFMATSFTASTQIPPEHRITEGKNARYFVPSRGDSSSSSRAVDTDAAARRVDVQTTSTIPQGAAAGTPNLLHTERREDMPMEELLRLLNERLQPGRWNDSGDELPPEYHEGRTM
ncbi:hypothetical protein EV421DRAFT_1993812 [Armillaria borealis]|uniref:Glycoside hydrolase family 76 protein n=1 Tax=Armillaria borealis TaxID=47425 RepID=A0AA39MHB5_9AGAR|nr:hypothetical protein EV421DRAFT_1993812 [Armillaria borealis]